MRTRVELANGYYISRVIKGGWQLAGGHGPVDRHAAITDMFSYAKAGITTFDFGDIYTGVEEMVGEFLRLYRTKYGSPINSEGSQAVQLHTKYVPDLDGLGRVDQEYTSKIVNRSLARLGVKKIDMVQFHYWDFGVPGYVDVAKQLVKLQRGGKIEHIGVTNFDTPHLAELIRNGIPVVSNQVQYSLLDARPEKGLVNYARENGIKLLCYGTLAGGFLSERYLGKPEPKEPLENRSLTKYKLIIDDFGGWKLFQELLGTLNKVALRHNVSISNVASKYILEKPQVAAVIVGARNTAHLEDTLKLFTFELTESDKKQIRDVLSRSPGLPGDVYELERDRSGKHGRIMKYHLNQERTE